MRNGEIGIKMQVWALPLFVSVVIVIVIVINRYIKQWGIVIII